MKIFRKMLVFISILCVVSSILISSTTPKEIINSNNAPKIPIKAAMFLYKASDSYMSEVRRNLEAIQKENEGKVEFSFFDGNGNQLIQNESIDKAINNNFDLFIINLVDAKVDAVKDILNKVAQHDIPLILDGTPNKDILNFIRPFKRTVFIGTDNEQAGTLEGKLIVDAWNTDKQNIDKNNDNTLQYIMLTGKANHPSTIDRTKYSILEIKNSGINTQELASIPCDWEKECARASIESLFLNYGDKVEAIIANNDAMAIGAVEALQKYGYNKGDKQKNILVVGIDAIPEAKELVNKGFMTGTVVQDARAQAEAIYSVGTNLVYNTPPLEGTDYKFDNTGIIIRIPYQEYVKP